MYLEMEEKPDCQIKKRIVFYVKQKKRCPYLSFEKQLLSSVFQDKWLAVFTKPLQQNNAILQFSRNTENSL